MPVSVVGRQWWMKGMDSTLLNIALGVAILGGSAAVTHLFARAMYTRCRECHTLNARRRVLCRCAADAFEPAQVVLRNSAR